MKIFFKPIMTSALLSDDQKNADIGLILVYDVTYKVSSTLENVLQHLYFACRISMARVSKYETVKQRQD